MPDMQPTGPTVPPLFGTGMGGQNMFSNPPGAPSGPSKSSGSPKKTTSRPLILITDAQGGMQRATANFFGLIRSVFE